MDVRFQMVNGNRDLISQSKEREFYMRGAGFFLALVASLFVHCVVADDFPPVINSDSENEFTPMAAAEAAAGLQLPPRFKASVFAAEPDIQNPIAMTWDHGGRLWVAENYTYSDRTQRFDLTLRDRLLILEDTDNDGQADSRKVFSDQLQMLTSVEVGRGGVWLMCPPQLLFMADANADDQPDGPVQVMLDGFDVAQDNYHNFANGLHWGPDGWLYGRCGHSCPGLIGAPGAAAGDRIPLDGGIWRFHPERAQVEVVCHGTTNPWGHDWDKHGELFFTNTVIGHLWHALPGAHFKESFGESMNPDVYQRIDMVADHYHFDTRGTWSESRDGKANDLGGGHAHIGAMIYQGESWPAEHRNKLHTINMHGRRINIDRLERSGAGYVGRHEPDFAISPDPFFRGIDLNVGPDGNVFVIDWSDTGECHEHTGVHRTSGRIYKISYESAAPTHAPSTSTHTFAKPACLRGDGPLQRMWKQHQAGSDSTEQLYEALRDPDEHVRVWAIRLLTDFWPLDTIVGPKPHAVYPDDRASLDEFVRMAREDSSGLVLLTLASTLQRLPLGARYELAVELIQRAEYAEDRDLPLLVWYGLIPLANHQPQTLPKLAQHCQWPRLTQWIARKLATNSESNSQALNDLLAVGCVQPYESQRHILLGLNEGFHGWRKASAPINWPLFAMTEAARESPELVGELNTLFGVGRAIAELHTIATDSKSDMKMRQKALESLIAARPPDLKSICVSLLDIRALNGVALKGLSQFDDPAIGRQLAQKYRRFQPEDRPAVLETLVSRRSFAAELLKVMAQRNSPVTQADLNAFHVRQIRSLNDEHLGKQVREVWGEVRETPAQRRQLIDALKTQVDRAALQQADLKQGRLLFNKTCSQCHQLYGQGQRVAPDLTGSQRSNLEYLLENIVDPSAVVGKDYRMSRILTVDGRIVSGLVVSKSAKAIFIQTQVSKETIATEDIQQFVETQQSPMPDGLLENLSPEQIRDLIAYLMHPSQVDLP